MAEENAMNLKIYVAEEKVYAEDKVVYVREIDMAEGTVRPWAITDEDNWIGIALIDANPGQSVDIRIRDDG